MKKCIINYITRNTWHIHGQARLKESLERVNFDGDLILFDNENFECTPHHIVPYAFKFHVLREVQKRGYELALWVDASFWAIRNVDNLFKIIYDEGLVVQDSGYPAGQWTSDDCLKRMGVTRDDNFKMTMFSGGFQGWNFHDKKTFDFFEEFYQYAVDGSCFKGAWRNRNNEVSTDKRCLGHRHDMSVGAILMDRNNIHVHENNSFFNYIAWFIKYKEEKDLSNTYFVCEGGPRKLPLKGLTDYE